MVKYFAEDIAQTILLELKSLHLDVGSSWAQHNSQLNHLMKPVKIWWQKSVNRQLMSKQPWALSRDTSHRNDLILSRVKSQKHVNYSLQVRFFPLWLVIIISFLVYSLLHTYVTYKCMGVNGFWSLSTQVTCQGTQHHSTMMQWALLSCVWVTTAFL